MKRWQILNKFTNSKGSYEVILPVISFKEDGAAIIFCPALDLSGSGNTETEAKQSFEIAINEYLNYTTNKGTLTADLKKLGWTILYTKGKKGRTKFASPPPMSELLETNDEFSRVFDSLPYKKFDTGVKLPAYA